jgi:hypothetical protein
MREEDRSVGRFFCFAYAAGWFFTGVLFFAAGLHTPVRIDPSTTHDPERLAEFFAGLRGGWPLYAGAFAVFALADFCMVVVGAVVRDLLGRDDFRSRVVFLGFLTGGLFGMLVDAAMLGGWVVVGTLGTAASPAARQGLWAAFVMLQSFGVWLSALGFLLGGACLVWASRLAVEKGLPRGWARMTLAFGLAMHLELAAIVFDAAAGTGGLVSGLAFLVLTTAVAPSWAVWTGKGLGSWSALTRGASRPEGEVAKPR